MTLIGLSLLVFVGIAAILLFLIYIAYPKKSVLQERIESLTASSLKQQQSLRQRPDQVAKISWETWERMFP